MSEEYWYIRKSGKVTGPFNKIQLEGLRKRGQLGQFHEVSQDKQSWVSAATLNGVIGGVVGGGAGGGGGGGGGGGYATQEAAPPVPPAPDWYYNDGATQVGPVSAQQIAALVKGNRLQADTQVWRDGFPIWVSLGEVPEFAGLLGGATPGGGSGHSGSGAAAKSARRSAPRTGVVAAAVGALLVVAVLGFVLVDKYRKGELKASALGNTHVINSLEDRNKEIEQAVGFVVCGRTILYSDGDLEESAESTGSCFAVSPDGYLVTNRHVVEEADRRLRLTPEGRIKGYCQEYLDAIQTVRRKFVDANQKIPPDVKERLNRMEGYFENRANFQRIDAKIWVFFGSKSKMSEASIVHVSTFDMCVLKVPDRTDGPYFSLAEEKEIPGRMTKVYALGFPGTASEAATEEEASLQEIRRKKNPGRIQARFVPGAFSFSLTEGSVSRIATEAGGQVIQHTASINPGNSGGPLVNASGKVVGINTFYKLRERDATATLYAVTTPQLIPEITEAMEKDRKKPARSSESKP